jgi:DNA primase large subunit
MALDDLRQSPMMTHLLDALERGEDIGHYGRLTFAMIAHHFLDRDELVTWLTKDKDCDEHEAKALVQQVEERDYNPPSRQRILEWQAQQDFPICPTPDDPGACNPYRELTIPEAVRENIEAFREQQFDAEEAAAR